MDFLPESSVLMYFVIFFGKIIEVSVSTMRMVMINRGERAKGAIIAFFDILLWLLITGTVLVGFKEDPLRLVVFALAFSVGNYMGSWFEDKLAFGLSSIQVIVPQCPESQALATHLRQHNFAVTVIKGTGKDGEREILMLHLKRKRIAEAVKLVNENFKNAVIVVSDSKVVSGGYIMKK
jgi:uncharacterized protein YebE (UPF0316 family)